MIDWSAFGVVALVSLGAAAALVSLYSLGLRSLAVEGRTPARTAFGYACFVVCALGVLYGIYLIIPGFHR